MSIASSRPPDQGRLPYLQQLAQRGDRRLLLGSVVFAAIGLVLAVRGTSVPAASVVAAAVLPAAWLGLRQAGQALARNGLAVVLSLQLSLLCHISGLNAALPIALLLGVLLIQRDRMPLWLAGAVGVSALLAPLLDGAAVLPPLLNAMALAVLTLVLGQTAARLRQQSEALGHGPHRLAALARDIATGADLGAHSDARNYAPGSLAHALADTARHVQAQRGREAEAHAENAQIRQALDASRTAMMIADNDHVIRYVNRSVVALLRNQQATLRQAFPDFGVGVAGGHHLQDLALPVRQRLAGGPGCRSRAGRTGIEPLDQTPGQRRRDGGTTIDHLQHRLGKVAEAVVLEQIAHGPELEGVQGVLVIGQCRDDDHLHQRIFLPHLLDQTEAAAVAQVQVDQQHIEWLAPRHGACFAQALRLSHQLDAGIGQQFAGHHPAQVGVIVDQQHAHRLIGLTDQMARPGRTFPRGRAGDGGFNNGGHGDLLVWVMHWGRQDGRPHAYLVTNKRLLLGVRR